MKPAATTHAAGFFMPKLDKIVNMNVQKLFLITATTTRLTRLITADTLAEYLIHDPLERKISKHLETLPANEDGTVTEPAWLKYKSGLTCPWCVGFWIGAGVLAAEKATRNTPHLRAAGKLTAEALSLNLITAPLTAHLSQ